MTEIKMMPIKDVHPYDKNPRYNDDAVEAVANSIRDFGFRSPIIVDRDGVIIAGHTRLKAARKLHLKQVPVIVAEDMTPEQAEAYRIADNSTAALADWDLDLLGDVLQGIDYDMAEYGLDILRNDEEPIFGELDRMMGEKDEDYQAFEDKFKPKYTTDDCFTPPEVYDALKGWVLEKYGISEDTPIVRPFYPGADYTTEDYPDGCLVLDNPPFSIMAQIIRFYMERKIDFFLFAPSLTLCHYLKYEGVNLVIANRNIVFDNGADIPISFVTNMGTDRIEIRGDLFGVLEDAQPSTAKELGRYRYPPNVVTAVMLGWSARYGRVFTIRHAEYVDKLDDGLDIYGGGGIISDEAATLVKAEYEAATLVKGMATVHELSDRERAIVEQLNKEEAGE